jgi:hypothetical protein
MPRHSVLSLYVGVKLGLTPKKKHTLKVFKNRCSGRYLGLRGTR